MASPMRQRCQAEGLLIWYNFHCTLDLLPLPPGEGRGEGPHGAWQKPLTL